MIELIVDFFHLLLFCQGNDFTILLLDVCQKAVFKLKQLERDSDVNTEDEKCPRRGVQKYSALDFTSGSHSSTSLPPPTPPEKRKRCSKET